MKRNVVEIYGPIINLDKASGFVQQRMEKIKSKVPPDELEQFNNSVQMNDDAYINGSLTGALDKAQVKYLIGKKGKHFKRITKEADVSFIWYDEDNHSVMIWGPQEQLPNAVQLLFVHIEKVKHHVNKAQVIDTCADTNCADTCTDTCADTCADTNCADTNME
jgi:hypothetical protein